ncbi:anti-sigma factor domain-containing protein [Salipiger sp.]|uniref:anti-sigma factor n=1 Tax=Salipiger sp. TaxID=2078585 RepID=UPI003A987996
MSGPEETDLPGGWEAAAAEYVLGLLPEDERRDFESRLARDRDLRQDVEAWEEYFASLTDPIPAVAPPPQVLRRVEAQLFGKRRAPFWRQIMPYLAGAVAAAAIAWGVMISGLLTFGPPEPDLWADLRVPEQGLVMLAHYAPESGTFMVRHDAGDLPTDRSLEIWMIAGPESAPVSIGVVDPSVTLTQIPLPREIAQQLPGATVALSDEPLGGSPTGAPTGAVVASGALEIR